MAHEPKLEIFRIELHPKSKNKENTFGNYLESQYESEEEFDINAAYLQFFTDLVSTISSKYYLNEKKKKGLGLEAVEDGGVNESIKSNTTEQFISGVLKGGRFGQNRSLGNIRKPEKTHEVIDKNNIVLDWFYFLLYTPFQSSKAILMIQSYTDDTVNDIFQGWLREMMRSPTYHSPILTAFCPKRLQEEFRNQSIVKEMSFFQDIVLDNVEIRDDTIKTEQFSIEITIKAKDNGEKLSNLPSLKKIFNRFGFKRPEEKGVISLKDFKKRVGRLHNGTHQSSFELDGDMEIKPTVYLRDRIKLEVDDSPNWESLHEFAVKLLEEVKEEVYPELKLIE
jgi:hypothetical protein